jgi:hypothetical protein
MINTWFFRSKKGSIVSDYLEKGIWLGIELKIVLHVRWANDGGESIWADGIESGILNILGLTLHERGLNSWPSSYQAGALPLAKPTGFTQLKETSFNSFSRSG